MPKKTGLEGAIADDGIEPGASIAAAEPVQPSLLAELAEDDAEAEAMFGFALDRSRGGRPPGRRNRNTEEVRRFVQAAGADPVVAASRIVSAGPAWIFDQAQTMERLVERNTQAGVVALTEKGIDAATAWSIWLRCVDFLGPYVHSKRPIDVNIEQPGLAIQINVGSPDAAKAIEAATGGRARWQPDPEKSDTCDEPTGEVTRPESHTEGSSD